MPGSQWFTGYNGQDVCIFDEYSGHIQINFMNRLMDSTECFVEIKGASVKFTFSVIIICCNRLLDDIYVNAAEKQSSPLVSLKRRISTSYWFTDKWKYKRYMSYAEMEADLLGRDITIRPIESNCLYVERSLPALAPHCIEQDADTEELISDFD